MSKKFKLPDMLTATAAAGSATAALVAPVIEQVFPGEQTWVPLPPTWQKNSVIIPLGLGAGAMAASLAFDSKKIKAGLICFGIVALVSAVQRGMTNTTSASLIQRQQLLAQQRMQQRPRYRQVVPSVRPMLRGSPPFVSDRTIHEGRILA